MSASYAGISWNRQKRIYDLALAGLLVLGLAGFIGVTLWRNPAATAETLLIRGTAVSALLLLHVILCLGPLARLDRRFLPLLYNRRHLGVTMFFLALVHGVFATVQFHALGDTNPLVSVFTAYRQDFLSWTRGPGSVPHFPFEPFGALALLILFLMAVTSHDFWLKTLGPSFWKLLHLLVYAAYGLVLVHVAYGALQSERHWAGGALLALGFAIVAGLHLAAHRREARVDRAAVASEAEGCVPVCRVDEVEESRGRVVNLGSQRVAVFRHRGRIYAVSNVCRHQGGPIGEGRIVDGCITCPWHGWNYQPEDGCSPPPFKEVLPTYDVRVIEGRVWVKQITNPTGARCTGAEG